MDSRAALLAVVIALLAVHGAFGAANVGDSCHSTGLLGTDDSGASESRGRACVRHMLTACSLQMHDIGAAVQHAAPQHCLQPTATPPNRTWAAVSPTASASTRCVGVWGGPGAAPGDSKTCGCAVSRRRGRAGWFDYVHGWQRSRAARGVQQPTGLPTVPTPSTCLPMPAEPRPDVRRLRVHLPLCQLVGCGHDGGGGAAQAEFGLCRATGEPPPVAIRGAPAAPGHANLITWRRAAL